MKTRGLFLFLFVSLFFVRCHSGNKTITTQTSNMVAEQPDTLRGTFYRHYTGKVGEEDAVFNLRYTDGKLLGNCYLKNSGRLYELMNYNLYDSSGKYKLYASQVGRINESSDDSLQITFFKNGNIGGMWFMKEGNKGVIGKEDYDNGSFRFTTMQIRDSLMLDTGNVQNDASIAYSLLQGDTAYSKEQLNLITEGNRELLGCKAGTGLNECIKGHIDSFFAMYRNDMRDMAKEEHSETNNYYESFDEYVDYNEHGIVSLELVSSSYTGGAHGYYFSRFYNVDLQNNKRIALRDVIQTDTVALRAIIEAEARSYFNMSKDTPLNTFLLVDTIPYTDNFYITDKGLVFSYAPYEIAAYVFGQVNILVPYDKLKHLLQPGFMERMR